MAYTDPEEVDRRLAALIERLQRSGEVEAATMLRRVRDGAYTTGSEWRGELGRAVREVERRFELEPAVRAELGWLMGCVHEVWPAL